MFEKTFNNLLRRPTDSHKYDYGHVLVIGGSPGMVGAPLLTGRAALRTGAGLVTIAAPSNVTNKLEKRVEEIMTLAVPEDSHNAFSILNDFIVRRKVSVLVIGPGLAVTDETTNLILKILKACRLPIIIDGGGLGALAGRLSSLRHTATPALILTPHTGEFQQLAGKPLPKKHADLQPLVRQFAISYKVTLVLKGHPTHVANAATNVYKNTTGNPGLATAGSGDVLSGVVAGMIAQGVEPAEAAKAGVYLHGLAGDIAAAKKTEPGMVASDVIEAIPAALRRAGSSL